MRVRSPLGIIWSHERTLNHVVLCAAVAFVAAGPSARAEPDPKVSWRYLANIGDVKSMATQYHDSGAYEADLAAAATPAIDWITAEAPKVAKPAVVFDIDETALSNWVAIKADDFGIVLNGPCDVPPAGPCGLNAWFDRGEDPAIASSLEIFNTAKAYGADIFLITGRSEPQRGGTERNLATVGYIGYKQLIMEPAGEHFVSATDFKAPQRRAIEQQGYLIIANIGDQPSDLNGGFSERTFQLPNPFYRLP